VVSGIGVGGERFFGGIRRLQVERPVWTVLIEVAGVHEEDGLKLPATEDQDPVEAVGAGNSDSRHR
jgi:hypothetical protein